MIHEIDLRATECRVRREELQQEGWRVYGADEGALRGAHDPTGDVAGVHDRIAELDDLVGSIMDLDKALRGMTRSAQERFAQAFEEVNRHFSAIFERLFEGGRAELRLVEAEEGGDPLETGVELMARPPRKGRPPGA